MITRAVTGGVLVAAFVSPTLVVACSSASPSSSDAPSDAGSDAPPPCGKPGERGNELGIGKFCNSSGDCAGAGKASVCATFLDSREHFCSMLCAVDGGPDQCGTDAVCACQDHICGCVPAGCAEDAGLSAVTSCRGEMTPSSASADVRSRRDA